MMTINQILIPTDFSETAQLAVAHGAYMAHLFKAKVFLLHTIESSVYAGGPGEPVMVQESDSIYHVAMQKLREVAEELEKKYDIDITTLLMIGKPAKSIAEAVKENNIDVIIMGTHGISGFEEFFIGSNAHKVVNLAPCPVISVQTSATKLGFSHIIMPISNNLHSRQKVNNVIELATIYKSTVHILGLLETNDPLEDHKFGIKLESVEHLLKKDNIPFTKKLARGHNLAVEAIKYSEELGGDLIVIMTDHESDLTGMFMGTVARQIVNHSKIPVMSIKPEQSKVEDFEPYGGTGVI